MGRLTSIEDLDALRLRLVEGHAGRTSTLVIPAGTCGQASGANALIRAAKKELLRHKLTKRVSLRVTGCHGFCQMEPSILVEPEGIFYPKVNVKDVERIVIAAAAGDVVEDLLYVDPVTGSRGRKQSELPFFRDQVRTLMSCNERVDPIRIHTYIEQGGYSGIAKVLDQDEPQKVLAEVKASGLRGRGGAGFPTGTKWEMLAGQKKSGPKYLVCNGDEGDPGAYMDRSLLEGNPHGIIEGMLIGAYATGAAEGVLYVRDEYPLAVRNLNVALRQARELGLLGADILGTGFSFDLQLVRGAGAFVCGEETALIHSVEGRSGEPRQRPPFPVEKGIQGKPTLINNRETWAYIPVIITRGAQEFRRVGTKDSPGTKIFSLVGKIKYTGLVEVPMGITIDKIVHDIGGGPSDGVPIKAVQTGGPSGGRIPADRFDMTIDYESLSKAGSIMGSGGMIVMDERTCMVDIAKYFTHFLKDESCGKCFTCRKGTQRMFEILDDISSGKGTVEHLGLLEELAPVVKDTAMCGLGQTSPNPVLSTLRYFRNEYLQHIERKHCSAGVCKELITYSINENCTGCRRCVKVCPVDAIRGEKKKQHGIDSARCTKCGACKTVCKFDAVEVR